MRTTFSSSSDGSWNVTVEARSVVEADQLRQLFNLQPKGLPCSFEQSKREDGDTHTRLWLSSPRKVST